MQDLDIDYKAHLSRLALTLRPNAIRNLTKLLGQREVISLAAGAPSDETFPIEELAEIAAQVIRDRGRFALQYGPTRGQSSLVEEVVRIMRSRGIEGSAHNEIVMTTGSQQGLDLISRILIDPGDVVLVELPSYIGGLIALHNAGADMRGVRQDHGGIVLDDLVERIDEMVSAGRRVKCIYTIPNFQNPSGVSIEPDRRQALVEIAKRYDLLIIEDDAYYELYFPDGGTRPRPLASLDPSRTIYLSSFSKVLAPGIRCAWLRAPEHIAERIEVAKEGADLSSSILDQNIVGEALRRGLIDRRLPAIREFYRVRCNAMLEALGRLEILGLSWTVPSGGFFVLLHSPPGFDAEARLEEAIKGGVAYVPGRPFFVDGGGINALRLAFSKETPERIAEGIDRLGRIISDSTHLTT
jgi:2-aminoadipate transaminase